MFRVSDVEVGLSAGRWLPGRAFAAAMFLIALALPALAGAVELRVVDPLRPIYDVASARVAPSGNELLLTVPRNGTASAQVVIIGEGDGDLAVGDDTVPMGWKCRSRSLRTRSTSPRMWA